MPSDANCSIFKIAPRDLTEQSQLALMGRAQLSPAWHWKKQPCELFFWGEGGGSNF